MAKRKLNVLYPPRIVVLDGRYKQLVVVNGIVIYEHAGVVHNGSTPAEICSGLCKAFGIKSYYLYLIPHLFRGPGWLAIIKKCMEDKVDLTKVSLGKED
jgi:hypothetical protein